MQREEQDLVKGAEKYKKEAAEMEQIEALHSELAEQKAILDTLQAQNHALQTNIRAQQSCCLRSSRVPIPKRVKTPPPDKGRGKGKGKGKATTSAQPTVPGTSTPQTVGDSDTVPSDRTPESLIPLVGGDENDIFDRGMTEPHPSKAEPKVQWKEEAVFYVCKVGEECWTGNSDVPAEVYCDDNEPACSIAEAVDLLKRSSAEADCYLLKETSTSAWYCLYRRGRKGLAREKMQPYVRAGLLADDPATARSSRGNSNRDRSRSGKNGREHGRDHGREDGSVASSSGGTARTGQTVDDV